RDDTDNREQQHIPITGKGANRLKFTPDGKRVLISGLGAGADSNLVVLDTGTRKEVKGFNLGGGSAGILIVPDGSRGYIAVSGKDNVGVVDMKILDVRGYVTAGKQCDGLACIR